MTYNPAHQFPSAREYGKWYGRKYIPTRLCQSVDEWGERHMLAKTEGVHPVDCPLLGHPVVLIVKRVLIGRTPNYRVRVEW